MAILGFQSGSERGKPRMALTMFTYRAPSIVANKRIRDKTEYKPVAGQPALSQIGYLWKRLKGRCCQVGHWRHNPHGVGADRVVWPARCEQGSASVGQETSASPFFFFEEKKKVAASQSVDQ